MKKIIVSIVLAAMLLALAMPFSVSAVDIEALKGTPVIDGKLEDFWKQSGKIETGGAPFYTAGGATATDSKASAVTYFLYDDNYFYLATVVSGDTTMSKKGEGKQWKQDAAEYWINITTGKMKFANDAFNQGIYGDNSTDAKLLEGCKSATSQTKDGYIVEFAVPISGKKAGDSIMVSCQFNDLLDPPEKIVAFGKQSCDDKVTLSSKAVELPVETTAAATKAAAEKAPAAAAQTADITAVVAIVSMAVSAGAVLSVKKRK